MQRKIDNNNPPLGEVCEFLTEMYYQGYTYSACNTARSALSNILPNYENKPFGQNFTICKLMKGIFESRPSFPRYTQIWDVNIVLNFLKSQSPSVTLNLLQITQKVAMLLSILTGHRTQTLHSIKVKNIKFNHGKLSIQIDELQKTSKPGKHIKPIVLQNYAPNRSLCVVRYLKEYLKRTIKIRNSEYLFIRTQKPHTHVSKDMLGKWLRKTMKSAGIDTDVFKSHSIRSATVSKASEMRVPIDHIMDKVGWRSVTTFQTYYRKTVTKQTEMDHVLLNAVR